MVYKRVRVEPRVGAFPYKHLLSTPPPGHRTKVGISEPVDWKWDYSSPKFGQKSKRN